MFELLSDTLQRTFRSISGKAVLSESNIRDAAEEVRTALLNADVNYQIASQFVEDVSAQALGDKVMKNVNPGQQFVKVVYDEMVTLMGSGEEGLHLGTKNPAVIMMCGLHGAGKTSTTAKLALHLSRQRKKVLMVACDVYRPAAIDQLEALGHLINIPVFSKRDSNDVVAIAREAVAKAKASGCQVVILDTAGRLQIDEAMVQELVRVRAEVQPQEILLTADAALGQEAVSVARHFNEALSITGIILTKLDGDARGGAALAMRKVTGRPIKFIATGEKPENLESFRPEGMASRILGMGDVVQLVREAEGLMKEEDSKKLEEKMKANSFDLTDFLEQMNRLRMMGGFGRILDLLPGGKQLKDMVNIDEKQIRRMEGIIHSMTPLERKRPELINQSRRKRIARGCGGTEAEINDLVKRFSMAREMMGKVARQEMPLMPGVHGVQQMAMQRQQQQTSPSLKDDKKKKRKAADAARKKNRR